MKCVLRVCMVVVLVSLVLPVAAKSEKISAEELAEIRDTQQVTQQKLAEMANLVNRFREEFQAIKGSIDENSYFNSQQRTQIEALEEEVRTLQDRLHLLSLEINDIIEGKMKPGLTEKQKAEADAYLLALDAYNADKLSAARDLWQGFLQKYPRSRFKPNAFYWIGETHFRVADYGNAIKAYQFVVESNPSSPWLRRAIFKQGVSFFELKDYESALAFFTKVALDYPKTSEAWRAQEYQKKTQSILKAQEAAKAISP